MSDLSETEQKNVRMALKFLRIRTGNYALLAKALRFNRDTVRQVTAGRGNVTASMALRVARLAAIGIDDLLTGKYPAPGTCPHCGHGMIRVTE